MGYWINPVLLIISARLFTQGLRTTGEDRRAAFIFSSVFFIWYAPALWLSSRQVKIRAVDRTIIFTHFFTRKRIVYYFTDIDGYVDMIEERPRGGPFRVLYLVKD